MHKAISPVQLAIGAALAVFVAARAQTALADEPVAAFCEPLGTFYPSAQSCPHPWLQLPMALLPIACKSNPNNFGHQQWAAVCALTMKTAIAKLQKQTQHEERLAAAEKLAADKAAAAKEAADKAQAAAAANPKPAPAQPDPYEAEINQETLRQYVAIRSYYAEKIENLYFAVGCKVFSEGAILPLVYDYGTIVNQEALRDHILEQSGAFVKAGKAGLAHASESSACDYWHQHTEEVVALRRLVLAASP